MPGRWKRKQKKVKYEKWKKLPNDSSGDGNSTKLRSLMPVMSVMAAICGCWHGNNTSTDAWCTLSSLNMMELAGPDFQDDAANHIHQSSSRRPVLSHENHPEDSVALVFQCIYTLLAAFCRKEATCVYSTPRKMGWNRTQNVWRSCRDHCSVLVSSIWLAKRKAKNFQWQPLHHTASLLY